MTPELLKYIDIEFSNWGYSTVLPSSLLVLVSLYLRLLVLKDGAEFAAIEGKEIVMGDPGRAWNGPVPSDVLISEWNVVVKLWSIVACEEVRRDERAGRTIDRRGSLRWRFRGEREWRSKLEE